MVALRIQRHYREQQLATAGCGQLVMLAYDGMIRALTDAARAMREHRCEAQNDAILRAQDLLLALLSSLDRSAHPRLADNLERLYRFLFDRLTWANVSDDEAALRTVTAMLADLRDAWAEAERLRRSPLYVIPSPTDERVTA